MKHIKTFEQHLNESKDSESLAFEIDKAIDKIDDSMGLKDFAAAVAEVIKKSYGSHNSKAFLDELKKQLK